MIPLEDNAADVIGKAQRGLGISDSELAEKAGVTAQTIRKLREGDFEESALLNVAPVLGLDGRALCELAKGEWNPKKIESFDGLAQFNTDYDGMAVNAYLVWDDGSREAFFGRPFWTVDYVGAGPYRLDRWDPGVQLEGTAFQGHILGRAKFEHIVVRYFTDENATLSAVLAGGQIDYTERNTMRFSWRNDVRCDRSHASDRDCRRFALRRLNGWGQRVVSGRAAK